MKHLLLPGVFNHSFKSFKSCVCDILIIYNCVHTVATVYLSEAAWKDTLKPDELGGAGQLTTLPRKAY